MGIMPFYDMPLEELKKYMGKNPCPPDIDEYWDNAIKEAEKIDLNIELKKIDYPDNSVEAYDLYFTSTNNARIYALYVKPKKASKEKSPCILEFHGYGMNSKTIDTKLKWANAGFHVLSMDCRGQGGKSTDPGGVIGNTLRGHIIRGIEDRDTLMFKHIFIDTYLLSKIAESFEDIDKDNIMTTGASQGGGLALACAALNPNIKKVAACYPFLCDYKRAWELNCDSAYTEIREWFRLFDPLHEREEEIFTRLGYIDLQHLGKRIKGKVLVSVGLEDHICPPSTIFAMYNKLNTDKQMLIYPDYGHEYIPDWDDKAFRFLVNK
jgi:cephalosporin-C deacetylase